MRALGKTSCSKPAIACAAMVAVLCLVPLAPGVVAQPAEPSPIAVAVAVPEQVAPSTQFVVQIRYQVVDLRAGADLNYNVFGPCHIIGRDPEPPNRLVNTWFPREGDARGTIQVQLQVADGSDGQAIRHQVQVRWGSKARVFSSETRVRYVPPTPTTAPTTTPTPRATPVRVTPRPTAFLTPTLTLAELTFLDTSGQRIATAEANQEVALQFGYTGSHGLTGVGFLLRFEPDVVNLEGLKRTSAGYTLTPTAALTSPPGIGLLGQRLPGRIRPYPEGGERYELRTAVEAQVAKGVAADVRPRVLTTSLRIDQFVLATVRAEADVNLVRAGGSLIVRVVCLNQGALPLRQVGLRLAGLPDGFRTSPEEHIVPLLSGNGGREERLFTIHAPQAFGGTIGFRVLATTSGTTIESEPLSVDVVAPLPLAVQVSADRSVVYAGESVHVEARCVNQGRVAAEGVVAKLVDARGNLATASQTLGDLAPGEMRTFVFELQASGDMADAEALLFVQTMTSDGTMGQSQPIPIAVACRPRFEVYVEPLSDRIRSGQAMEAAVELRNVSPCIAREVLLAIDDLPAGFALPPAQQIAELAPGTTRHLSFSIVVPRDFEGAGSLAIRISDGVGGQARSMPAVFAVVSVPVLFTVVFGLLVVLAAGMVVFGAAFYFQQR